MRTVALLAVGILAAVAGADDKAAPKADALALGSEYQAQPVSVWGTKGYKFSLSVTLEKKDGQGSLSIDPNINWFDEFGDDAGGTEVAIRTKNIILAAVNKEDPTGAGRRLYEISGAGLTERLFLVVPGPKGGTHRLLVADEKGKVRHVFPLRTADKRK